MAAAWRASPSTSCASSPRCARRLRWRGSRGPACEGSRSSYTAARGARGLAAPRERGHTQRRTRNPQLPDPDRCGPYRPGRGLPPAPPGQRCAHSQQHHRGAALPAGARRQPRRPAPRRGDPSGRGAAQDSRQPLPASDVLILSNTTVAPLYLPALAASLGGRRTVEVILPDGEAHKTLASAARVLDVLVANRFGRDCAVLALGGGVVGDLAGFAAACYQRGVAFAQVPTTLLAQVDSAVGGKTGVNHPGGKNLIGAFHQPVLVVSDTATLATLPERELRAGLAEVIKYGLICDAALFAWLEEHLDELLARDGAALAHVIRRSCEIKAAVVVRDEREQGERALLNLGHTFGHALESATGYGEWLHGGRWARACRWPRPCRASADC